MPIDETTAQRMLAKWEAECEKDEHLNIATWALMCADQEVA